MSKNTGVPPQAGSGRSAEPEPISVVSAETASVPNADELPTVIGEGVVKLGDLEITVLQLSNGERVIEEQSFNAILHALFGSDGQSERTGA